VLSRQNLFRIKFVIALFAISVVTLVGQAFYKAEEKALDRTLRRDTEVLSETIEQSFRHHMVEGGVERAQQLVDTISQLTTIGRIRIYDREGTIRFSSLHREVGTRERKTDPACRLCHEGPAVEGNVTVSFEEGGRRFVRSVNPIRKEEACQPCHADEEGLLGILMVDLSMDEASEVRDDFRMATVFLVLSITLVFGILVFLNQVFDWFNVKP